MHCQLIEHEYRDQKFDTAPKFYGSKLCVQMKDG